METTKETWEPIEFGYVGDVSQVLRGGGGKLSLVAADMGDEPRKPKGGEPG